MDRGEVEGGVAMSADMKQPQTTKRVFTRRKTRSVRMEFKIFNRANANIHTNFNKIYMHIICMCMCFYFIYELMY